MPDEPGAPAARPRIADIIPRLQLRGAEIFAQHLEVALRDRYDMRLFTMFADESHHDPLPVAGPPLDISEPPAATTRTPHRFRTARNLGRHVREFGPDLVVAHGGDPLRAAALARLNRIAPIVYVRVSSVPPHQRSGLRGHTVRAAYRRATSIVAVSDSLRAELIEVFGIQPERVRVIPNGRPRLAPLSDDDRARLRAEAGASPGDVLVAWSGRMVPEKDPSRAVEIARRLRTAAPDARLVMIGDGQLAAQTREASHDLSNVRLLGVRPDAPSIVAASDAFLSTSTTEGAPGTIIEALLAGVPVVAPNVGGIAETVPETAGVLTPPGDQEALASAVADLSTNEPLRNMLAAGALATSERFGIRNVSKEYDALYRSMIRAGMSTA